MKPAYFSRANRSIASTSNYVMPLSKAFKVDDTFTTTDTSRYVKKLPCAKAASECVVSRLIEDE